jgi:hypothetical protein
LSFADSCTAHPIEKLGEQIRANFSWMQKRKLGGAQAAY